MPKKLEGPTHTHEHSHDGYVHSHEHTITSKPYHYNHHHDPSEHNDLHKHTSARAKLVDLEAEISKAREDLLKMFVDADVLNKPLLETKLEEYKQKTIET